MTATATAQGENAEPRPAEYTVVFKSRLTAGSFKGRVRRFTTIVSATNADRAVETARDRMIELYGDRRYALVSVAAQGCESK